MTDADVKTPTKIKNKIHIHEPSKYHVIYINDDVNHGPEMLTGMCVRCWLVKMVSS